MIKKWMKYYYRRCYQKWHYDCFKTNLLAARQLAVINSTKNNLQVLDDVAFQVFSQRGEDGVIQYICSKIEIPDKTFIEFGVEDYTEANTRLLLFNNWRGLVMDGSKLNIRFIKRDFIYWKYDITALQSFITAENINSLVSDYTGNSDIGLLSIDIDGNDYWVWNAISTVQPRIIICEYNSALGCTHAVAVPYQTSFFKTKAHYSNLYYGASLPALCFLANKKGYDFIGTTAGGVNAFFVRKDLSAPFVKHTAQSGFHESANRDSRDKDGRNTFLRHHERLKQIKELPVVDVVNGTTHFIKELYRL